MSAAAIAFRREAVAYPQNDPYLCVHRTLVLAMDGDFAAAAIVSFFTFRWQYLGRPFHCTHAEICEGTMNAASSRTVRRKVAGLVNRGFIAVTDHTGNPEGDEYTVFPEKIQDAVLAAGRRSPLRVQPNPGQMAAVNPGQMAEASYKANNSKKSTTTASIQTTESAAVTADAQNGSDNDALQRSVSADPETKAQMNSGIVTMPDPEAVKALTDAIPEDPIAERDAIKLVRAWGAERVTKAVAYWKRQDRRRMRHPPGLLVDCVQSGRSLPRPPKSRELIEAEEWYASPPDWATKKDLEEAQDRIAFLTKREFGQARSL